MGPVHTYLLYDYARERQQDLLTEMQRASLAKAACADSTKSRLQPTLLTRVVLSLVVWSLWTLLS